MSKNRPQMRARIVYRIGDCEVAQTTYDKFEVRKKGRLWSVHQVRVLAEDEASREAELR